MKLKPIPSPIKVDKIIPPIIDYEYFEDHKACPFLYTSHKFQMVNAWWLADSAMLAYSNENFARPRFEKAGLTRVEFFDGKKTDSQCYVASNENFVIVAFRGAEPFKFEDMLTYLSVHPVKSSQGGKVHAGFKMALDELWSDKGLKLYLDDLKREIPARTFWFTGHSLGAALATIGANRYDQANLYTFGSPMVGTKGFRKKFKRINHRFVYHHDLVTRLPPKELFPYRHVGRMKYIDPQGNIHDGRSGWFTFIESIFHIFDSSGGLHPNFQELLPGDHLTDHSPLYYALHIWNNHVKDQTRTS